MTDFADVIAQLTEVKDGQLLILDRFDCVTYASAVTALMRENMDLRDKLQIQQNKLNAIMGHGSDDNSTDDVSPPYPTQDDGIRPLPEWSE